MPCDTQAQFALSAIETAVESLRNEIALETSPASIPASKTPKRLMNVAEGAVYMGRTETAIRQLIYKKFLPVVRIDGRVQIDVRDLDKLIEESKV